VTSRRDSSFDPVARPEDRWEAAVGTGAAPQTDSFAWGCNTAVPIEVRRVGVVGASAASTAGDRWEEDAREGLNSPVEAGSWTAAGVVTAW
jgi:hypothetical protein